MRTEASMSMNAPCELPFVVVSMLSFALFKRSAAAVAPDKTIRGSVFLTASTTVCLRSLAIVVGLLELAISPPPESPSIRLYLLGEPPSREEPFFFYVD